MKGVRIYLSVHLTTLSACSVRNPAWVILKPIQYFIMQLACKKIFLEKQPNM